MYSIKDYVDAAKLKLLELEVTLNLDDPTIQSVVNDVRLEVQMQTLDLFQAWYGRIGGIPGTDFIQVPEQRVFNNTLGLNIDVYQAVLPVDVINPEVVVLTYQVDGISYPRPARRVDTQELYSVQAQSQNMPTLLSPVYAVEKDPDAQQSTIYLSGVEYDATFATIFDLPGAPANIELQVWRTAVLDALELAPGGQVVLPPDTENQLPWEFTDLVVQKAVLRLLQKSRDSSRAQQSVESELAELEQSIKEIYDVGALMEGRLLPSRQDVK